MLMMTIYCNIHRIHRLRHTFPYIFYFINRLILWDIKQILIIESQNKNEGNRLLYNKNYSGNL